MAAEELALNASGDYSKNEQAAARYPKFEPVRKFETLWSEFCRRRNLAASSRKKWKPYFEGLIRRLGSDDMGRVTEEHLIEWRDALLETVPSPVTVKDGYPAPRDTHVVDLDERVGNHPAAMAEASTRVYIQVRQVGANSNRSIQGIDFRGNLRQGDVGT